MIDAFKIKELNLLILSFLFRQTHNSYIKNNKAYTGTGSAAINEVYFSVGAIAGVIITGILADAVLKNKNFLTVFILNFVLFCWDIYLFCTADKKEEKGVTNTFSTFLGAILASADLCYLILIPMLIAKQHSEKMALTNQYTKICFAGTIVGVVLALCEVGKFLFSDNIATFLNYLTEDNKSTGWDDLITAVLLLIANLILWAPIKREMQQTRLYQRCCLNRDSVWNQPEETEQFTTSPTFQRLSKN